MGKKITVTEEVEFSNLLATGGGRCQAEFRVSRTTSFGRCPEHHLQPSKNPNHPGPIQLTLVKINRTKKLFCQWCTREIMDRSKYDGVPQGRVATIDAAQIGMFQ